MSINIKYIDLKTFMDVEIRASDDDFDKTEGLCGILNGPCDDDLIKQDSTALPVICSSVLPIISQEMSDYWRFVILNLNIHNSFQNKRKPQIFT